jgi:hypothetical protein
MVTIVCQLVAEDDRLHPARDQTAEGSAARVRPVGVCMSVKAFVAPPGEEDRCTPTN